MRLVKEKLISIGGRVFPKFNQIIFLAGGAGSGKGWVINNLLGIEAKVIDVDSISGNISKSLVKKNDLFIDALRKFIRDKETIDELNKKEGGIFTKDYLISIDTRLSKCEDGIDFTSSEYNPITKNKKGETVMDFFDPSNPTDVSLRYYFQKSFGKNVEGLPMGKLGLDDLTLLGMVKSSSKGRRPNIIIDTTLGKINKIKDIIDIINFGLSQKDPEDRETVDPKDVSIVWVLTPMTQAILQNAKRVRKVGIPQLYNTHKNSTQTMRRLFKEADTLFDSGLRQYVDGDIIIVFNNNTNIVVYKDDDPKQKPHYIEQYTACIVKEKGKPITPLDQIQNLPLVGGAKGQGQILVGDLVNSYTNPAMLAIASDPKEDNMVSGIPEKFTEAKARNLKKVKSALTGKNDLIKTWGIITAENPIGLAFPDDINAKRDKELRNKLAQSHLEYIKVKGQYGNKENSLFIINPALSDLEKIAAEFGQESFIFATNSKDGDFSFDAGYYEMDITDAYKDKQKKKLQEDPDYKISLPFKYKKSYTKKNIIDQKDADDFFTSIDTHGRKFKFQIPFFESTIRRAYERLTLCTEGKDIDHVIYDIIRTTTEADHYAPSSRWRIRGSLYKS